MNTYNNSVVVKFDTKVNGNAGVLAPVTVYLTGTETKANLFSPTGAGIDNPVFTNSTGNYTFDIEDGFYDIVINEDLLSEVRLENQQIATVVPVDAITGHYDTLQDAISSPIIVGQIITTTGYHTVNDGGAGQYIVVPQNTGTDDGGSYLDMVNGNQLELVIETPLNPKQWGAVDAGGNSTPFSTQAIQAALNTGLNIELPHGTFLLDNELLINTAGQTLTGQTNGAWLGNKKNVENMQTRLKVPLGTTIPSYTKTRRNARTFSADPVDAPISCMINIEAVGVTVANIFGELECDYTDFTPSNLGADCDVFVFNGCRGAQVMQNLTWLGYFRVAGILLDSTRGTNLVEFETPSGVTYSSTGTNGGDQIQIKRCQGTGGLKQIYLRGPVLNGLGTYYDEATGLLGDSRGGSGNSDLKIDNNCVLEGRDHHSGYRAYDFIGNPDLDDIESISCPIMIDAVRGSASQGRTRRVSIYDTRLRTIEVARLFTARAYEVYLDWFHSEPLRGFNEVVYDTGGNIVDPSDTTNQTYGPLACQSTSGNLDGTDQVRCEGVWGTGLVSAWCRDLVDNFSDTRRSINPQFTVDLESDLNAADDITAGDKITALGQLSGESLVLTSQDSSFTPSLLFVTAPTYVEQKGFYTVIADMVFIDIFLDFTGLDVGDTSNIAIAGLPENKSSDSSFNVSINTFESSALNNPSTLHFDSNGSSTQIALYDDSDAPITYNSGRINASGGIKLTLSYRF